MIREGLCGRSRGDDVPKHTEIRELDGGGSGAGSVMQPPGNVSSGEKPQEGSGGVGAAVAQLRASPFLEGQQQLEPREGQRREGVLGCMSR